MRLAVVDVETTFLKGGEFPQTLFWGLKIEGEDYRKFTTTRQLWKFLEQRKDTLCLYHHHDYDAVQAILDKAPLRIRDVRGGRILRSMGPNNHEWRNSYALFDSSLKAILEACGFEKPELDNLESRNIADTEDALTSFRLLAATYHRIWGIYPLCGHYLTAASVAFAGSKAVAGPLPIYLENRDSYRGGRVEAFRLGECGEADLYDINSSYPFAFLNAPERDTLYYARVKVDTDGPGPLCHIADTREKLLFPAGEFRTAFWASNYDRFIRPHGAVTDVEVIKTVDCDFTWLNALKPIIERAYQARLDAKEAGDEVTRYCVKIGLNSIYGRLGMKPMREVAVYSKQVASGDDVGFIDTPGGFLSFKKVETKPQANYLFASFITDNARARLYDALARTNPFYCDTDSVYVPKGSEFPLAKGPALGSWKPEGTGKLYVTGAKDYTWGDKEVLKGGKKSYQWTMKRMLAGKPVLEVNRTRRSEYDKREVLPSGKTLPLQLHE